MSEGITCYERDETLCEDQMCMRTGCRLRNDRLARSSTGSAEVIARIIDPDAWLLYDNANALTKMEGPVSLWRVEPSLAKADAILSIGAAQAAPKSHDWVNCPICNEPDMRKETFDEGAALIHCTNHACPSNSPVQPTQGGDKGEAVTDEMVTAAMRAFELMSSVLRYREKDKWHAHDIMGMRDAIRAALKAAPQPLDPAYPPREYDSRIVDLADKIRTANLTQVGLERFALVNLIIPETDMSSFADALAASALPSTPRGTAADYCHAHQGPVRLEGDKCPLCSTEGR